MPSTPSVYSLVISRRFAYFRVAKFRVSAVQCHFWGGFDSRQLAMHSEYVVPPFVRACIHQHPMGTVNTSCGSKALGDRRWVLRRYAFEAVVVVSILLMSSEATSEPSS